METDLTVKYAPSLNIVKNKIIPINDNNNRYTVRHHEPHTSLYPRQYTTVRVQLITQR